MNEDTDVSKYQQVYNHPRLHGFAPSSKVPHIDALERTGLLEELTVEQATSIVIIAQQAYRSGQAHQGAEKIDNDAVWLDGVGGLEKQPDGAWKLTMPDKGVNLPPFAAASALGSIKSEKKSTASRENGKKGGRPRRSQK